MDRNFSLSLLLCLAPPAIPCLRQLRLWEKGMAATLHFPPTPPDQALPPKTILAWIPPHATQNPRSIDDPNLANLICKIPEEEGSIAHKEVQGALTVRVLICTVPQIHQTPNSRNNRGNMHYNNGTRRRGQ